MSEYVSRSTRGREAFPVARTARAQAGPLRPRATSATRVLPAAPTATSPRRSAATRMSSATGLCCASSVSATTLPGDLDALAEHCSAVEREAAEVEYGADSICLAWLLDRRQRIEGSDERFAGEIIGLIDSGLFVRFGEVFEGFLPVAPPRRRLLPARPARDGAGRAARRPLAARRSRSRSKWSGSSATRARSRCRPAGAPQPRRGGRR